MEKTELIIVNKQPSYEEWTELVELMTYYKLAYPIGLHEKCQIYINDKEGMMSIDNRTYKLSNSVYIKLHLLTNEIIANLYKTVQNDKEV